MPSPASSGDATAQALSKVPHVTLAFWVIKILATTLGETGGDVLSMTLKLGYLASTGVFLAAFLVMLAVQVSARRCHPYVYWAVVLATTTAGTTMSDYLDRTAGLGYIGGSMVLVAALAAIMVLWRISVGSIAFEGIRGVKVEVFYWVTILFSNTLGTAVGDFLADDAGLGYEGGALAISVVLAVIALAYFRTRIPHTALFWAAFVLTRPLGATVGDLLTKPHESGGLALGTIRASVVIAALLILLIRISSRRRAAAAPATSWTSGDRRRDRRA